MKLNQENQELLGKARKKIDIANKFRLTFLFIAVIGLVFIYFGNKIWENAIWYQNTLSHLYLFLFADIFFMLAATITKLVAIAKYNRIVKNLK